jgi:hypothetical protein
VLLFFLNSTTTMPLPQDDTLPQGAEASSSHTNAPPSQLSTEEVIQKFQNLGEEAAAEEDEEDDEVEGEAGEGVDGEGAAEGAGGEGGKKKKKKKKNKSKASKAVAKLK